MSSSHNHTSSNNGDADKVGVNDSGEIKILVCSGNLGNAQPDEASWNEWVPMDGYCGEVVKQMPKDQKYPLRRIDAMRFKKMRAVAIESDADDDEVDDINYYDNEDDQFNLIVIGMQESTFSQSRDLAGGGNGSDDGMGDSSRPIRPIKAKTSNKALTALQTLSTSVDYISKESAAAAAANTSSKRSSVAELLTSSIVGSGGSSPTHAASGGASPEKQWMGGTQALHALMAERLPSYERVVSFQRGEMRLEILAHQTRTSVEVIHVTAQNTGRAGLANKGGIVAELLVNGRTRLSFLTAHLEAHEGATKYQTRVSTIGDILTGTRQQNHDCSQTAHYSFVMGDLNFRTEMPNHAELDDEEHKQIVRDMVARQDWDALNRIDELQRALKNKECLVGYQTLFCNFPPTFKVERQLGYVYIDKRRPSYTDRVLWKTNNGYETKLRPLVYEPVDNFTSSDHKPIRAAFSLELVEPFLLRPKMVRRRSALNMSRLLIKKKGKKSNVSHKERFHLFVADMSCVLYGKGLSNAYICMITDPPEALQQPVLKGWRRVKQELNKALVLNQSDRRTRTSFLTSKGFPRSSVQKQTTAADWGYEEIHAEVTTHRPDGSPIDLSGSMLHFTIMDYRTTSETCIGSFSYNMANLIQSRRPPAEKSNPNFANKPKSSNVSAAFSAGSSDGLGRQRTGRRMSLMNVFGKKSDASDEQQADPADPIETIQIDEPILKSGVETGRIKFKLEAWWMDEWTRKAFANTRSNSTFFPGDRMRRQDSSKAFRVERRGGQVHQSNSD